MYSYNTFFSQYWLYILGFIIVMYAQARVQNIYQKYKMVVNHKQITGEQAAHMILNANGLSNVHVELSQGGLLSDHYDPVNHVIRLSPEIFNGHSIASISIAAHEVGHAIQHKEKYGAIALRNQLLPAANFASRMGWFVLFIGLFLFATTPFILYIGLTLLLVVLLFQIVTLPIEFNASSRAVVQLNSLEIVTDKEKPMVRSMLNAAAFTYVAAVLATIAQLFRILLIAFNRNNRN